MVCDVGRLYETWRYVMLYDVIVRAITVIGIVYYDLTCCYIDKCFLSGIVWHCHYDVIT